MISWGDWRVTTIQIYYWIPDHKDLLQEFVWQTEDLIPEFPRVHKFLWHWKNNIIAPIESIQLSHSDHFGKTEYINCKKLFDL